MRKTPQKIAREWYVAIKAAPKNAQTKTMRECIARYARTRKQGELRRVMNAFITLAYAAEGMRRGSIRTASELDAQARKVFAKRFPDVEFEERIDPSLIGGAVVEVADERIDASVKGRLGQFKKHLTQQYV